MSKSTKCFILILIIGTTFYILRMKPHHIQKNYESVLLKTSNNEYKVDMKIEGKTTRESVFSNVFIFKGRLEIQTEDKELMDIPKTGELFLSMHKDYSNLYNGMLTLPPLEKTSHLLRIARLVCSNDFEKIYINGYEDFGYKIYVKINPPYDPKKFH